MDGGRRRHCDFFFQAEDGIRDRNVTGVQTCALPISLDVEGRAEHELGERGRFARDTGHTHYKYEPKRFGVQAFIPNADRRYPMSASAKKAPQKVTNEQIGRASCRERGENKGVAEEIK